MLCNSGMFVRMRGLKATDCFYHLCQQLCLVSLGLAFCWLFFSLSNCRASNAQHVCHSKLAHVTTYIHTYIRTRIYVDIHTHIHIGIYVCMYIYNINMQIQIQKHTDVPCIHTDRQIYMSTYMYTSILMYARIETVYWSTARAPEQ